MNECMMLFLGENYILRMYGVCGARCITVIVLG